MIEQLDDDAALAVYADELQQRGDPQGELIALALAGHGIEDFLIAHHDALFGDAAPYTKRPERVARLERYAITPAWRRGLLDDVQLDEITLRMDEAYALLSRRPLARQPRTMSAGWGRSPRAYPLLFEAMLQHGVPPRLRELRVPDYTLGSAPDLGGMLAPVVAAAPLEVLEVFQGHHLGRLASASLATLTWTGAHDADVAELAAAELPALRSLQLTGTRSLRIDGLSLGAFPHLTELQLEHCDPHGMFERIAEVAPRLASVTIRHTVLTRETVYPLLDTLDRFAHLRLSIPGALFPKMIKAGLLGAIPQVTFNDD